MFSNMLQLVVQYRRCNLVHHTHFISNISLRDSIAAAVIAPARIRLMYIPLHFSLFSQVLMFCCVPSFLIFIRVWSIHISALSVLQVICLGSVK